MAVNFRDNDVTAGLGFYTARSNWARNIEISDRRAPVAKLQEFATAGLSLKMARAPIDSRSRMLYNCAIGRDSGISAVKSTTSTVAFISADLNSDINLTKLSVSILGHKQHNFQFLDRISIIC